MTLPDNIAQAARANPHLAASLAYPHRKVDAVEALDALVATDGNLVMTSQRLKASPQSILAAVVQDDNGHALLSRYLRAFTMTKTFELVATLHGNLMTAINEDELEPKDVAKLMLGLVQSMSSLTESPAAGNMDPFTALMKVLPAEEREALKVLVDRTNTAPAKLTVTAAEASSYGNDVA